MPQTSTTEFCDMSLINAHFFSFRGREFVLDIGRTVAGSASEAFVSGARAYQEGGREKAVEALNSRYGQNTAAAICGRLQDMLAVGCF